MGFLLKEVLKTLCNRNQWSYAVFWKIGCNNSKLLIWEECYHEPLLCPSPLGIVGMSNFPNQNGEGCWFSSESQSFHLGIQEEDKVSSLINKMTVNNLVIVAGEGMIGRAAFTNSHQWILLNNFAKDAYPPEVYAEVHHQFSAGMQTVAVIPVLPHGVVQLGSFLPIMENMGFVHEVKSLILQLGCIPGALLSEDYSEKLSNERLTEPATSGVPMPVDSSVVTSNCTPSIINIDNRKSYLSHASKPNIQTLCPLREKISKCQGSEWTPQTHNLNEISNKLFQEDRVVEAEVIPSNFNSSLQQHSVAYNARSEFNNLSSGSTSLLRGIPVHGGMNSILGTNLITSSKSPKVSATNLSGSQVGNELQNDDSTNAARHSRANLASRSGAYDLLQAPNIPSFNVEDHIPGFVHDCFHEDSTNQSAMTMGSEHKEACAQPPSGDDLFDILGVDFKNKLLEGHWNELFADQSNADVENKVKKEICTSVEGTNSDYYSVDESMLDSGIFSGMSTDHLLDAVVSKAKPSLKQSSDDMSCRTALTVNSTSSIPSPVSRPIMAGNFEGGLFDFSKYRGKKVAVETSSLRSGCSKDDAGNCSQTTTICGSRLSSWLENGGNVKHENSVSTGYSKRPDEACKSNRKRLKPGENPRPRPKDRQMIQDRVKELREIVPNGAKCSIDALLERTIKHMLFLQSVTKHADKLKQSGESKIISKEGGLLLKDNFEGGATWAYEVGSQSMVCPIIVEDLDPPRQMLVEMLCEERGFFLEIADLIRGLGLTILKGVMEAHNGKIWARFVVEANRDVTRMEIFMSLVRLLEQTMKGNAFSSNAIDNMIGYNSLPQNPTQIAATGRPNSMK